MMHMLKLGASVVAFFCFFVLPCGFLIGVVSHHNVLFVMAWIAVAQLVSTQGLMESP